MKELYDFTKENNWNVSEISYSLESKYETVDNELKPTDFNLCLDVYNVKKEVFESNQLDEYLIKKKKKYFLNSFISSFFIILSFNSRTPGILPFTIVRYVFLM